MNYKGKKIPDRSFKGNPKQMMKRRKNKTLENKTTGRNHVEHKLTGSNCA